MKGYHDSLKLTHLPKPVRRRIYRRRIWYAVAGYLEAHPFLQAVGVALLLAAVAYPVLFILLAVM